MLQITIGPSLGTDRLACTILYNTLYLTRVTCNTTPILPTRHLAYLHMFQKAIPFNHPLKLVQPTKRVVQALNLVFTWGPCGVAHGFPEFVAKLLYQVVYETAFTHTYEVDMKILNQNRDALSGSHSRSHSTCCDGFLGWLIIKWPLTQCFTFITHRRTSTEKNSSKISSFTIFVSSSNAIRISTWLAMLLLVYYFLKFC